MYEPPNLLTQTATSSTIPRHATTSQPQYPLVSSSINKPIAHVSHTSSALWQNKQIMGKRHHQKSVQLIARCGKQKQRFVDKLKPKTGDIPNPTKQGNAKQHCIWGHLQKGSVLRINRQAWKRSGKPVRLQHMWGHNKCAEHEPRARAHQIKLNEKLIGPTPSGKAHLHRHHVLPLQPGNRSVFGHWKNMKQTPRRFSTHRTHTTPSQETFNLQNHGPKWYKPRVSLQCVLSASTRMCY